MANTKISALASGAPRQNADAIPIARSSNNFRLAVSDLMAYTPSGSGAVVSDFQTKLRESVSVKDFGAVGNGVADDTTAIQAAINSLPATGGRVYFPSGTYRVSSAITVNKPGIYYGDGYATKIQTSSATANVFTVTGAEQVEIRHMLFNSSVVRSAGWFVDVATSANRFRLADFYMDGAINGVRTLATATSTIERGQILNCVASTGVAVRIDDGFDVTVRDVIVDAASQIFSGIYITKANDVCLEDLQIIKGGQALYLNPTAGNVIASLWANNCFFDNSSRGLFIDANGGTVVRSLFDQCWFSSNLNEGVRLATAAGGSIDGTDLNGCHVFLNAGNGIAVIDSSVTNTRISDCAIAQNTSSGVFVGANVNSVSIQDSRIGATHGLTANNVGVTISAGTGNNIQVLNNDLRGNTSNNLVMSASGLSIIVDNNLGANESWTTYTPTITTGTGTITTLGTVAGRYQKIGKQLFLTISIPITTNGTGATDVRATLPAGMTAAADNVLFGRENSVTGNQLQGVILATSGTISITRYDNAYPGGNGHRLIVSGVIETA